MMPLPLCMTVSLWFFVLIISVWFSTVYGAVHYIQSLIYILIVNICDICSGVLLIF